MGAGESKTPDSSDRYGTKNAVNAEGCDSEIGGKDATINTCCAAGNPNCSSNGKNLPECSSGTNNAFNAKSDGKVDLSGGTFNTGAFAGGGGRKN